VELQEEVDARREEVFELLATSSGLARWLDAAELEPRVGGAFRFRMRDATAIGKVLALDPPQHISFEWTWETEPLPRPSVVAFDAIDHGARTHVTIRQVGLQSAEQVMLHEEMWRYWMSRFVAAIRSGGDQP